MFDIESLQIFVVFFNTRVIDIKRYANNAAKLIVLLITDVKIELNQERTCAMLCVLPK